MTTPGFKRYLICPYCKSEKGIGTINSGNTFGGTIWSDTKRDFPMLPRQFPIQQCQTCQKFFFLKSAEESAKISHEYGGRWDNLNYPEVLMASQQFQSEGMTGEEEEELLWCLIHTFNDTYQRGEKGSIKQSEFEFFKTNVLRLINLLSDDLHGTTVTAELYREIREFNSCLKIIEDLQKRFQKADRQDFIWNVINQIETHAKAGNSYVFRIE